MNEVVTGTQLANEPFIMRVKVPVLLTPDQSYFLKEEEKVTADGFETPDASL